MARKANQGQGRLFHDGTHGEPVSISMCDLSKGLLLAQRVHQKYQSVFDKLGETERAAVALYFLPHGSKKGVLEVTRPRVVPTAPAGDFAGIL